jgi:chemotaxis signal transduction protein
MVTVLDLVALSAGEANSNQTQQNSARQIVALKGDEQLALAVDDAGETITVTSGDFVSSTEDTSALVMGVLRRENSQTMILNLKGLFPASIQGRERRRRRF